MRRFMDMVVVGRDSCEKMCLEMSLEDEDGRRSLSILVHERRGCNQVNVRRRQRKIMLEFLRCDRNVRE